MSDRETFLLADAVKARAEFLERNYEALCRAECRRQGINPDDIISDAGHMAWELAGHEAAERELALQEAGLTRSIDYTG